MTILVNTRAKDDNDDLEDKSKLKCSWASSVDYAIDRGIEGREDRQSYRRALDIETGNGSLS